MYSLKSCRLVRIVTDVSNAPRKLALLFGVGLPRQKRADQAWAIYHALNRGNRRQAIFQKNGHYEAFLRVLSQWREMYPVELFSFVLMPNHWHMVLRPTADGGMGRLLRWVTATHKLRYHAHYGTSGEGHFYHARFLKVFP